MLPYLKFHLFPNKYCKREIRFAVILCLNLFMYIYITSVFLEYNPRRYFLCIIGTFLHDNTMPVSIIISAVILL